MQDPSHTQLEILRQESERGDWAAARQAFIDLDPPKARDAAELELALAVWAKDSEGVAAAIAKLEAAESARLPIGSA